MVELVVQRLKRSLDLGKIHHPPFVLHKRTFDVHRDAKAVTVQPTALMCGREVGQSMRCFKRELAKYFHGVLVSGPCYGRGDLGPI